MKNLLVVVDYQNDFVSGTLGFKKAQNIEDNIAKIIGRYIKNKDDIVFTLDTHDEDYLKSTEGENLPIKHAIKNTNGWQIYGKIKQYCKHAKIITKNTFGAKDLGKFLEKKEYKKIEFVGVVSHMCVMANVIIAKTWQPNAEIVVQKNSVASFDVKLEKKCIDLLKSIHIKVK